MWVKVCGWNDPLILRQSLALALPDAIGLNFYPPSVRSVTISQARELRQLLPPDVSAVGVFVNHSREEILEAVARVGLTHIQLHGDESPEFAAALAPLSVIRVYRLQEPNLQTIDQDLHALSSLKMRPWACLVDAWHEQEYGGTGQIAPWKALRDWPPQWPPLILAGGLNPSRVVQAIDEVGPFGVDVASGVESSRGVKDPERVAEFVNTCRGL